jgi:hypothetical protein
MFSINTILGIYDPGSTIGKVTAANCTIVPLTFLSTHPSTLTLEPTQPLNKQE